jgi:predicted dithiol-disulfide oxidoreductase (DUF899 family)
MMENHKVVSQDQWIEARKELLAKEKEFTRLRDALSQQRRDLPWVRVDKAYEFEGPDGKASLAQLFEGRRQLIIQHFMLGPDWEAGCKSCSFWADNFNGIDSHLAHRDVTFLVVSQAPFPKLDAFKRRMGWSFKWVSSFGSDFNYDYGVSFKPEDLETGEAFYNYAKTRNTTSELPGVSVFYRDPGQPVFHTYSCYARGLDMLNGAYNLLDLVPKGRDEAGLPHTMAWVRLHDEYDRA